MQYGHDPVSQIVARGGERAVGRILDPAEVLPAQVFLQRVARLFQQRPSMPTGCERHQARHACETRRTRAAQQLQQQGLGLVVAVVCGQQDIAGLHQLGQRRVACRARRRLEPLLRCPGHAHPEQLERNAQRIGHVGALGSPSLGLRL